MKMIKRKNNSCEVYCSFGSNESCTACCYETEMPLTKEDLNRIEGLGYSRKDFTRIKDGLVVLKNVQGHCFFLKANKCSIYKFRPEGCRLYPLVYDIEREIIKIDPDCPHHSNFEVKKLSYAFDCLLSLVDKLLLETD